MLNRSCLISICVTIAFIIAALLFIRQQSTRESPPESQPLTNSLRTRLESQRASNSKSHRAGQISDKTTLELASAIDVNQFKAVLDPIMVERVVGTESHENVKNYIANEFQKLNWFVEFDSFEDVTPKGKLPFTNIIVTHNANADRYLALACHYDSKLTNFKFIGATDAAVPCAMLIYLAQLLRNLSTESKVALKLIFFDGEEAFVEWSAKDSIYGSRHLASKWHARKLNDTNATYLHKIDLLVLLDLLGAPSPKFYSLYANSDKWFRLMASIERRLRQLNLIEAEFASVDEQDYYFQHGTFYDASIEDDHVPFLKKSVPILHLIALPFPEIWHKAGDDMTAVNLNTVKNLLRVVEIFVWQYLSGSSSSR